MTIITNLASKVEKTSAANAAKFVAYWKANSSIFNLVNFEEDIWDVTGEFVKTGRGQSRTTINFTTFDAATSNVKVNRCSVMSQSFLDVAKAYTLYSQSNRPGAIFFGYLTALRAPGLFSSNHVAL